MSKDAKGVQQNLLVWAVLFVNKGGSMVRGEAVVERGINRLFRSLFQFRFSSVSVGRRIVLGVSSTFLMAAELCIQLGISNAA